MCLIGGIERGSYGGYRLRAGTASEGLDGYVRQIRQGMVAVCDAFSPETTLAELSASVGALEELDQVFLIKQELDTLIAYLADKLRAGYLARSGRPADFLSQLYGISIWKANQRIRQARDIYDPSKADPPTRPETNSAQDGCDDCDEACRIYVPGCVAR